MPRPRGLKNLGNTCFLNSVIQAISSCPPIVEYLEFSSDSLSQNHSESFSECLLKCIQEIRGNTLFSSSVNIESLLRMLADNNPDFEGRDQQDAEELFQLVCKIIAEERTVKISKSSLKSCIHNININLLIKNINFKLPSTSSSPSSLLVLSSSLYTMAVNEAAKKKQQRRSPFEGLTISQMECHVCHGRRRKLEPFIDISLHIQNCQQPIKFSSSVSSSISSSSAISSFLRPNNNLLLNKTNTSTQLTLEKCIHSFLRDEVLDQVNCDNCTAMKSLQTLENDIQLFYNTHGSTNNNNTAPTTSNSSSSSSIGVAKNGSIFKPVGGATKPSVITTRSIENLLSTSQQHLRYSQMFPASAGFSGTYEQAMEDTQAVQLKSLRESYGIPEKEYVKFILERSNVIGTKDTMSHCMDMDSDEIRKKLLCSNKNVHNGFYLTYGSSGGGYSGCGDSSNDTSTTTESYSKCGDNDTDSYKGDISSDNNSDNYGSDHDDKLTKSTTRVKYSTLSEENGDNQLLHLQNGIKSTYSTNGDVHDILVNKSRRKDSNNKNTTAMKVTSEYSNIQNNNSLLSSLMESSAKYPPPSQSSIITPVRTRTTKSTLLTRLPPVLCFHINRTVYDAAAGRMKKLNQIILFPAELDMQQYMRPAGDMSVFQINQDKLQQQRRKEKNHQNKSDYQSSSSSSKSGSSMDNNGNLSTSSSSPTSVAAAESLLMSSSQSDRKPETNDNSDEVSNNNVAGAAASNTKYELRAVIQHQGSENGGHYSTYCRVETTGGGVATSTKNWMYFSDEVYRKATWAEITTCDAYMLLYVKK